MIKSNILNLKSLLFLLILLSISSCSNTQTNQKQALKHLVFFQFKAEATEEMKNEAARDIYLPHPEHVRVVEANKPVLSDLLVVDVWGEE